MRFKSPVQLTFLNDDWTKKPAVDSNEGVVVPHAAHEHETNGHKGLWDMERIRISRYFDPIP